MPREKPGHDDTVGQPRRASDSRPRPGSGTPTAEPAPASAPSKVRESTGDRKPSELSIPGAPAKAADSEAFGELAAIWNV